MKKIVRIVGLCSRPLQQRYLAASPAEREKLQEVVAQESGWILDKMSRKGYQLEATVDTVLGVFTRGTARGRVRLERETSSVA